MSHVSRVFVCLTFIAFALLRGVGPIGAQTPSSRIALVVGNSSYVARAMPTAPNDAGLVAQTLTAAGFDVTGARDLDADALRRAVRDFLDHASHLGPDGIAFVYFAGLGAQFSGDNYFVPTDAALDRDTDVPLQAFRMSDLTRALAALPLQSRVVVLDGAYANAFPAARNIAGGMALVEPDAGMLLALNAAPGTIGPTTTGSYGVYALALADLMRQPGVPVEAVFDRVRLRVNQATQGSDVPWSQSKVSKSFVFLEPVPGAPQPAAPSIPYADLQTRPLRDFTEADAYNAAVARDDFVGYRDYLTTFPKSPYARRVRILLAARREALTWHRTATDDTPDAYWSYLVRYPSGLHAFEARRRLRALSVALAPPPSFAPVEYDVPPPPESEVVYVDRPVVVFADPDELPPPPPPIFLLPPPLDDEFATIGPPPPPIAPFFLPIPVPIPIPFGRPFQGPGELRPPRSVQGSYPQPQPFLANPQGGLQTRPVQGGPNGPPSALAQPTIAPALQPHVPPGAVVPASQAPGGTAGPLPAVSPVIPRILPPPSPQGPTATPIPHAAPDAAHALPVLPGHAPSPTPGIAPAAQAPLVRPATAVPAVSAPPKHGLPVVPKAVMVPAPSPGQGPAAPPRLQAAPKVAPAAPNAARTSTPVPMVAPQPQVHSGPTAGQQQQQPLLQQQQTQRAQQLQQQQQRQQADQVRQQQIQQQRIRQDQQRQQAAQQQRQQQEQVRQQQIEQQRVQQDQQRQQAVQQQRQQQEQVRQQQIEQQRVQQDQQRQQAVQQQRQQQEQVRQQQIQQQRVQQDQQRQQQSRQQAQPRQTPPHQECGKPGQPACR